MSQPDISDLIPTSEQHAAFSGESAAYEGNTQAWINSPARFDPIRDRLAEGGADFHNAKEPNLAILSEKPSHRLMCYLKAQGLSNREVALRVGVTESWVSNVLRQPWARLRIAEEMQSAGRDAISTIIEAAAEDSIYKLIELRDSAKMESVQLQATNSILDRFLGKPTQKVEQQINTVTSTTDVAQLQDELKAAQAEMNRLGLMATVGGPN